MASRSYAPRHALVSEGSRPASRAAAVLASTATAAAVAGTALAAPASAAAHHHTVWDRVARCESGAHWHINTGNGFYGGLQFSAGTWSAYGGHTYAHHANRATRPEQIEVARRVLKAQGPGAWPVCGPRAGLTRSNGKATSRRLPARAESPDGAPAKGHAKKRHGSSHHGKGHHHTTRHHTKRHHTTGHHKTRHASHGGYVVRSGDTLIKIARSHHVHGGWHALYRANRSRLASPNELRVGQHIRLP